MVAMADIVGRERADDRDARDAENRFRADERAEQATRTVSQRRDV